MSTWPLFAAFIVAAVLACWPSGGLFFVAWRSSRWPLWRAVLFFGYSGIGLFVLPLGLVAVSLRGLGWLLDVAGLVVGAPFVELRGAFRGLTVSEAQRARVAEAYPRHVEPPTGAGRSPDAGAPDRFLLPPRGAGLFPSEP